MKRNNLKQEYYKVNKRTKYWKDKDGKPTKQYMNWLEDKILEKKYILTPYEVSVLESYYQSNIILDYYLIL